MFHPVKKQQIKTAILMSHHNRHLYSNALILLLSKLKSAALLSQTIWMPLQFSPTLMLQLGHFCYVGPSLQILAYKLEK